MKPKKIEDMLKEIKNQDDNLFSYLESQNEYIIHDSRDVLNLVLKNTENKELIEIAKVNHIINLVRALENDLKYMFALFIDELNFPYEKIAEKISRKLEFSEILPLINQEIKMGELLTYFFNFQNLDEIQKLYSNLFQVPSFFEYMKKNIGMDEIAKSIISQIEQDADKESMRKYIYLDDNLRRDLDELISIRHNYVHNTKKKVNLDMKKIFHFESLVIRFLTNVSVCGWSVISRKFNDEKLIRAMIKERISNM
jgi:hypothetical protein